jgi:hypothetical protein
LKETHAEDLSVTKKEKLMIHATFFTHQHCKLSHNARGQEAPHHIFVWQQRLKKKEKQKLFSFMSCAKRRFHLPFASQSVNTSRPQTQCKHDIKAELNGDIDEGYSVTERPPANVTRSYPQLKPPRLRV